MAGWNLPDGCDDPADLPDEDEYEDDDDYDYDDDDGYDDPAWDAHVENQWYPGPR